MDPEMNPDPSPTTTSGGDSAEKKELKWGLYLDLTYIKSRHGILTAAITIVSLIAFICCEAGRAPLRCEYYYGSAYNFFGFVTMSAFLTGLLNYILYILAFYDRLVFKFVPWNLWWVIWCAGWCLLYFIASIVVAAKNCGEPGNAAAAVFGFATMVMLGVHGYFCFLTWREERGSLPGPQSTSSSTPEYNAEKNMEQY